MNGFCKKNNRPAFTLIEVLAAMVLGILLLSAVTLYMGDIAILYTEERSAPTPIEHAETLSRFLEQTFANALPIDNNTNNSTEAFSWQQLPDAPPTDTPRLAFRYTEYLAPLTQGDTPTMERICFLQFESDVGFSLLSYPAISSDPPEETIRRTQLSPHVTAMHYLFFDEQEKTWERLDHYLEDDSQKPIPAILQLTLRIREDDERTLSIPLRKTTPQGTPLY